MKAKAIVLTAALCTALLGVFPVQGEDAHANAKESAVGYLKQSLGRACPLATYETDDPLIASASYTYDTAVAALAFMAEGDYEAAGYILDSLVTALQNDPEYDDRIRNAYMAGDPMSLPGYWNNEESQWKQDAYQVGTGTKSSAAAALAFATFSKEMENVEYLDAAMTCIDWVLHNCQTEGAGFTSGYVGWESAGAATVFNYKSAADNLWMAAACDQLYTLTGWQKYGDASSSARDFLSDVMYSEGDSRYFTGTEEDGVTPVRDLIMTEVQALSALTLKDDAGLDNLQRCKAKDGGYSFDNAVLTGSYLEGTALAALAFKTFDEGVDADAALSFLEETQLPSGALCQASLPGLTTGEKDRVLNDWPCVGATAWFILAVDGVNPLSPEA